MRTWLSIGVAVSVLAGCSSSIVVGDGGGDGSITPDLGDCFSSGTCPDGGGGDGGAPDSTSPDSSTLDAGTDMGTPEPCKVPGASEMVACGMCGQQTRFCTSARVWEYAACMGEHGVCVPGSSTMQACGMCGTQAVTCNTTCAYVPFGTCSGEHGECLAGASEITGTGCAASETHRHTCDATCMWGAFSTCTAIPADLDGDGANGDVDCDDTDPTIRPGTSRPCGNYRCGGSMFGGTTGTQTCVGPDWAACVRPSWCTDPTGSCTAGQMETQECPEARWHCAPAVLQTRACAGGTWPSAWSGTCPAITPAPAPPAMCAAAPTFGACGTCGEGIAYTACDAHCMLHAAPCTGTGCTPGSHTRTTTGCPTGQYQDAVCTAACSPGTPSACMSFVPMVDVMITVDNTGSHTGVVMASAMTLAMDLVAPLEADMDVQVGVATFADFNAGGHGGSGDVPFIGQLAPTHDSAMVAAALAAIPAMGGGDLPESHVEALNDLADGTPHAMSRPFTCPVGTVGGGCWRPGAQRVIVVMTDAPGHSMPDGMGGLVDPYGSEVTPAAPTWASVQAALIATGTLVFYILPDSSFTPTNDPNPQARAVVSAIGEDPVVAISNYPRGAADVSAATADLAPKLAAYVGVMLGP